MLQPVLFFDPKMLTVPAVVIGMILQIPDIAIVETAGKNGRSSLPWEKFTLKIEHNHLIEKMTLKTDHHRLSRETFWNFSKWSTE